MRIEEKSKSLNKILDSLPDYQKKQIRAWWRNKIFMSFILAGITAVDGFLIGLIIFGGK